MNKKKTKIIDDNKHGEAYAQRVACIKYYLKCYNNYIQHNKPELIAYHPEEEQILYRY